LGYAFEDGVRKVKLRRLVETEDKYDQPLKPEVIEMSYAFGATKNMRYHGQSNLNRGNFKLDLNSKGTDLRAQEADSSTLDLLIKAHGIVLIICWGFLADISIIFARYFRTINIYVDIHMYLFVLIDLATIIMSLVIILQSKFLLIHQYK
jgi:hypothetical protein